MSCILPTQQCCFPQATILEETDKQINHNDQKTCRCMDIMTKYVSNMSINLLNPVILLGIYCTETPGYSVYCQDTEKEMFAERGKKAQNHRKPIQAPILQRLRTHQSMGMTPCTNKTFSI